MENERAEFSENMAAITDALGDYITERYTYKAYPKRLVYLSVLNHVCPEMNFHVFKTLLYSTVSSKY